MTKSTTSAVMIALLRFLLALFASLKSKSRLDAENAALRHQLIVLKMRGRIWLTNGDRLFFVSCIDGFIIEQRCADFSSQ